MSDHRVHLCARRYCFQSRQQALLAVLFTLAGCRGNYRCQLWIRASVSSFLPGWAGQPVLGLTVKGNKQERRVWRGAINCLLCQGTAEEGGEAKRSSLILHIHLLVINESLIPPAAIQQNKGGKKEKRAEKRQETQWKLLIQLSRYHERLLGKKKSCH